MSTINTLYYRKKNSKNFVWAQAHKHYNMDPSLLTLANPRN